MLGFVLLVVSVAVAGVRGGNTTCKTTSLDWYTQSVGESPCRTYERLRQTCNPQYQVGNFGPNPPGDQCDDQVSTCCCNSVAFALSMLCENCQYGIGSGIGGDVGFDGAPGTYQIYLGGCGAGTNQSLPNITQTAVCNQGISIPNYLYTLFWGDGAWFYEYTRGDAALKISSGQNVTKFCNTANTSKTSSIATSTPSSVASPSATSKPQDNSSSPNIGAIVGGVVGGVALLAVAGLLFWFNRHRRSRRDSIDLAEDKPDMTFEPYVPPVAAAPPAPPSTAPPSTNPTSYGPSSSSGYTYTNASSDIVSSSAYPSQPRPTKAGMVARSPPTREEIRPSMPGPVSSAYSSERHEDSTELSEVFGLGRSASGRLPPTYQER